ncbi:DUF3157 family protein [Algibacter sp. AS12]|uniref:DUF3157 family protein n=1 Tax=Algibacter sp. AS12 TaxID=3135773 RepID=UPI00398BB71D
MKTYFFLLSLLVSSFVCAQNNHIVNTEDGRRVLLNADFTWEYIDGQSSLTSIKTPLKADTGCNLAPDFKEPALNSKIQAQLKKGRATISHVKAKVAKDNNCTVEDVLLLLVSEQKSKATYQFCANGILVAYKRIGNTIIKKQDLF